MENKRPSYRFDFTVPTAHALHLLARLIIEAHKHHKTWEHPDGMEVTHSFVLSPQDDAWKPCVPLIRKLMRLPHKKVSPPWAVTNGPNIPTE